MAKQHAWDKPLSRMLTNASDCPKLLTLIRGSGHHFFQLTFDSILVNLKNIKSKWTITWKYSQPDFRLGQLINRPPGLAAPIITFIRILKMFDFWEQSLPCLSPTFCPTKLALSNVSDTTFHNSSPGRFYDSHVWKASHVIYQHRLIIRDFVFGGEIT